jgi:hypothetical protein
MTCAHVLDLIDAGPFAGCSAAHLAAAWEHAQGCPTCGPALGAATALTAGLSQMPQVAAPPTLAASVLARIARIDEIAPASVPQGSNARSSTRDWSWWATAAGVVLVVLAMLPGPDGAATSGSGLLAIRGVTMGLVATPSATIATLLLATGLVVYMAGLFAPIRDRRRP